MYILRAVPDDDHERHVLPDGRRRRAARHRNDRALHPQSTGQLIPLIAPFTLSLQVSRTLHPQSTGQQITQKCTLHHRGEKTPLCRKVGNLNSFQLLQMIFIFTLQEMFVSVVSAAIVFPVTIFVILVFRTSNSKSDGNDIGPSDSDDYNDNYDDIEEANRDLDDMSVILGEMNSNNLGWPNIMSEESRVAFLSLLPRELQ